MYFFAQETESDETSRRKYVCEVCKKRFTRRENMKRHERIHNGVYELCPRGGLLGQREFVRVQVSNRILVQFVGPSFSGLTIYWRTWGVITIYRVSKPRGKDSSPKRERVVLFLSCDVAIVCFCTVRDGCGAGRFLGWKLSFNFVKSQTKTNPTTITPYHCRQQSPSNDFVALADCIADTCLSEPAVSRSS